MLLFRGGGTKKGTKLVLFETFLIFINGKMKSVTKLDHTVVMVIKDLKSIA